MTLHATVVSHSERKLLIKKINFQPKKETTKENNASNGQICVLFVYLKKKRNKKTIEKINHRTSVAAHPNKIGNHSTET